MGSFRYSYNQDSYNQWKMEGFWPNLDGSLKLLIRVGRLGRGHGARSPGYCGSR